MIDGAHQCTGCGEIHTPKQARKTSIDKQKLGMLKEAAELVKATGSNRFTRGQIDWSGHGKSAYTNWATIARFGLIASPKRGEWLITPLGWAFLRGKKPIKSWVKVKDGHIRKDLEHGPYRYINELKDGIEPIQTNFEYFDDEDKPVGVRPQIGRAQTAQLNLL